jgi:hypothetical protein
MKVSELIKELEKMPQDSVVGVYDNSYGTGVLCLPEDRANKNHIAVMKDEMIRFTTNDRQTNR